MLRASSPRGQRPPAPMFGGVPRFMIEEDAQKLMRHAPPYGYKFGTFRPDELLAKRRNATLPANMASLGTCAVVGSSGTLLTARFGAEIDAHDAVIRVNGAPLGGSTHGPIVGSKVTWRVFASPHAASDYRFHEEQQYPNQTLMALCDRPYVYSCQNVMYARRKPRMHGINPRFYEAVRKHTDQRKKAIPLTGVVAVALAIRSCDSVDVYGMSTLGPDSSRACFYYWRCGRGQTDAAYHSRKGDSEFHDFKGNARALLNWNASGAIRIRI